jgi:hypothetical protein
MFVERVAFLMEQHDSIDEIAPLKWWTIRNKLSQKHGYKEKNYRKSMAILEFELKLLGY